MKSLLSFLSLLFLSLLVSLPLWADDNASILGVWQHVGKKHAGEEQPTQNLKDVFMIFDDGVVTRFYNKPQPMAMHYFYRLDAATTPKQILRKSTPVSDYIPKATYQLFSDTLIICIGTKPEFSIPIEECGENKQYFAHTFKRVPHQSEQERRVLNALETFETKQWKMLSGLKDIKVSVTKTPQPIGNLIYVNGPKGAQLQPPNGLYPEQGIHYLIADFEFDFEGTGTIPASQPTLCLSDGTFAKKYEKLIIDGIWTWYDQDEGHFLETQRTADHIEALYLIPSPDALTKAYFEIAGEYIPLSKYYVETKD